MKIRAIRNGGDYIAIDIINSETSEIFETPIYLQINKSIYLLSLDVEEAKYMKTKVTFNGKNLDCEDKELKWQSDINELIETMNGRYLFKP